MCAGAAEEITEQIHHAIQKGARGVEISREVMLSLQQIVDRERKVDQLVTDISSASTEQTQGISQVLTAVTQMDQVTQQNASTAEESASASEELNAQASSLQELVDELNRHIKGPEADAQDQDNGTPPSFDQGRTPRTKLARVAA
jgi:methyl-accepting chemotaxis protein